MQPIAPQLSLDLGIEIERDIGGVEMGVLENGISFLTQRGLAKLCGVSPSVIAEIAKEWEDSYDTDILSPKQRLSAIQKSLNDKGYNDRFLYIRTFKNGTPHYAYPDIVCMGVLIYFTFDSKAKNDIAQQNLSRLATQGLQKYIYDSLGYKPSDKWKYFHDRISILKKSPSPDGYWDIFTETAGLVVALIENGLTVNDKTIPDSSVGTTWGPYWTKSGYDKLYGARVNYPHMYPDYYPQSKSNPQPAWAYPDSSLGAFREWFRTEYLPKKFPNYILSKVNSLPGGKFTAQSIIDAVNMKQIK
jgi:hypothetical protein